MKESPPEIVFFTLNGSWLSLYDYKSLAEDATIPSEGSGFTLSHNVTTESKVYQIIERAVSVGAILIKEPQKASWGGYSGYFKDPDGYLWEVAFNPYFWIGPEDNN
jgi:hypothetical protein